MKPIAISALLLAGCATAAPNVTPTTALAPTELPTLQARLAALDAYLAQQQQSRGYAGLAVGVVNRGGLIFSKGYGVRDLDSKAPVGPESVFRLGSITKVFTGLAVLQLRDDGKLDLDAPASRYLPELGTVVAPSSDSPPITLRHLLTHTSGLSRNGALPDPVKLDHEMTEAELRAGVRGSRLLFAPGTGESYSNLGVALVGLIIAQASGQPYADFVRARLLAPLGMTSATFDRQKIPDALRCSSYTREHGQLTRSPPWREGASLARGGLYASVNDVARFMAFELSAWPPRDDPDTGPAKRATVRESQRTAGPLPPGGRSAGIAWVLQRSGPGTLVWHNGAGEGFASYVSLSTDADLGLVLLSNVFDDSLDEVAHGAQEILYPHAAAPAVVAASPAIRSALALLDDPSEANARRRCSKRLADEIVGNGFLGKLAQLREAAGPCTLERATGPTDAVVSCGRLELDVSAIPAEGAPEVVDGISVRPRG